MMAPMGSPEQTTEQLEQTIAQLQEQMVALQEKYEQYVPKGIQRTVILLGLAALLKKPWIILLALGANWYQSQQTK